MNTVFIVGKFIAETDSGNVWDLQGVFLTEDEAVSACVSPFYWVGPVTVGEVLPDETLEWPGLYYPVKG